MLFFNSQSIPELSGLSFQQRMSVVRMATDRLSVPIKLLLNIIKLIILFSFFMAIARAEGWYMLYYSLGLVIVYPLITRPLTFYFARRFFRPVRFKLYPELSTDQEQNDAV
ncbi:DUF6170 family protein [Alishewanella longhuensis]